MLNSEILINYGFKKINNSMFRKGNITLQPAHSSNSSDLYESIVNQIRGYKVCKDGRYLTFISNEEELLELLICI